MAVTSSRTAAPSRVRLDDVARLAKVSLSTASLAFREDARITDATRARVLDAAESLGYAGPDPRGSGLRRGRSGVVAVVFSRPFVSAIQDDLIGLTVDGLVAGLGDASSGILMLSRDQDGMLRVGECPVDAVVMIGDGPTVKDDLLALRRRRIPTVTIDLPVEDPGDLVEIATDYRGGAVALARHLREQGHEHVGIVLSPTVSHDLLPPQSAAAAPGLAVIASSWVSGVRSCFPGAVVVTAEGGDPDSGENAVARLFADSGESGPSAVIVETHALALGALAVRDVAGEGSTSPAVACLEARPGSRVDMPSAVTLVRPAFAMGEAAGQAVVDLLSGTRTASRVMEFMLRPASAD